MVGTAGRSVWFGLVGARLDWVGCQDGVVGALRDSAVYLLSFVVVGSLLDSRDSVGPDIG